MNFHVELNRTHPSIMLTCLILACFPRSLQPNKVSPPLSSGSYVFLMDTGMEIFIWRGANATLSNTTKAR